MSNWENFYKNANGIEIDAVDHYRAVVSGSMVPGDYDTCMAGLEIMKRYSLLHEFVPMIEYRAELDTIFEKVDE